MGKKSIIYLADNTLLFLEGRGANGAITVTKAVRRAVPEGALINGLRYSDTFSKIGMLSPALGMYPENGKMQPGSPLHRESMLALLGDPEHYHGSYRDYEAAMRKALEKPQDMPRLFLACGTEDPLVYQAGRDFAHRMQAEGAPMTYYEAQGGHDHVFWKHAMTPLCEFLTAKGGK